MFVRTIEECKKELESNELPPMKAKEVRKELEILEEAERLKSKYCFNTAHAVAKRNVRERHMAQEQLKYLENCPPSVRDDLGSDEVQCARKRVERDWTLENAELWREIEAEQRVHVANLPANTWPHERRWAEEQLADAEHAVRMLVRRADDLSIWADWIEYKGLDEAERRMAARFEARRK
jgi:hypothetical protein